MQHCWNENPDQRPSFSEIKTYLQGHLNIAPSKTNNSQPEYNEAAAYRPSVDGHENIPMTDVVPGSQLRRNDYLDLLHEQGSQDQDQD